MTDTPYRVISCEKHSQYELLAMHRQHCRINTTDNHQYEGRVTDILTRDRAEYLQLTGTDGQPQEIRLDLISAIENL